MRSLAGLVAITALTLGSVACGSDDADDDGDADDPTGEPAEEPADEPADDGDGSSDTTVSEASWSVATPPAGAEFPISVAVGSSSCDSFDRIEVEETADAVTITAFVATRDAEVCTDDFVMQDVTVSLDAPLGERSLLGCRPNADDDPSFDCR